MAHNSKPTPYGTAHTSQPHGLNTYASFRSRPSSSMSMRSTTSSGLSQRPAINSLTIRNTPSRPASQLSFSKTPSYLSKRGNSVSVVSPATSQSLAGTVVTSSNHIEPVPETHSNEASAPNVAENQQDSETFSRVTSQREERINRHVTNEMPSSESDDEDLPDPRMFVDIPGLRLPALEDLKRRHAERNERRQAKAAEKARIAAARSAFDAGSTVNQDVSPTPSLQALTPQTSASAPTEQAVNEEVPPVQPAAAMPNDSYETENAVKENKNPVEAQNSELETSSNTSAKLIPKPNLVTCSMPKIQSPVSEMDDNTCEMDWEIVLITTSSFKAIRPRVSRSEPGFVRVLDRIRGILEGDEPFLPAHKRHDLEVLDDFQFQPESAYGSRIGCKNYSDMNVPALTAEMEKIIDIVKQTNKSQLDVFPCYELHRSVLRLAFGEDISMQDLNNAQICYQFLVDDTDVVVEQSEPVSRAELVKRQKDQDFLRGFGLGLIMKNDELRSGVKQFLKKCNVPSITPSMYRRMRMTPVGAFMGSSSLQDPVQHMRSRLFVWAASWFKRFDLLRTKTEVASLPVLPLISAEGDIWRLFFACRDDFEHVVIVGPVVIGSTAMVQETYRLVAVLQVLGEWLHREFRAWVENLVTCPSK